MSQMARILVIDDEESMCNFMEIMLSREGYAVDTVSSPKQGINLLKEKSYDLVIADLQMPEMTGIELLQQVKSFKAEQEIFVMTAYASVDTAITAMKEGATDYITKPFKVDQIKLTIDKALHRKKLETENAVLRQQLAATSSFDTIIGRSEKIVQMKKLAQRIAGSDSTVLIRGESGTGKDLMARALHQHSPRAGGPFVTINCAALPETLLESELFGHKKGSFTGAIRDKDGLFKVADGGTFFLDEVGNTSLAIQVKLLRVLEDRKITPVGDTHPIEVDVRLIAATNADLEDDAKAGRFRSDLFYRLNVLPIVIPPLRERAEDIPLLVEFFIGKFCGKANVKPKAISSEAMGLLSAYSWPGNIRELENTLERAVLLNRTDRLESADFPERLVSATPSGMVTDAAPITPTLESIEKAYIHYIMTQTEGKKAEAARILGIDASTLYRKLERYKLHGSPDKEEEQKSRK